MLGVALAAPTSALLDVNRSVTQTPLGLAPLACRPAPPAPRAQVKRAMQLPKLSAPPPDFVKSMEAYLAEAPRPAEAEAHKVSVAPWARRRVMGRVLCAGKEPLEPLPQGRCGGTSRP